MITKKTCTNLDDVECFLKQINQSEEYISEIKITYIKTKPNEYTVIVLFTDEKVEPLFTSLFMDDVYSEFQDIYFSNKLTLIFRVYPQKNFIRIETDNNVIRKITIYDEGIDDFFNKKIQYSCVCDTNNTDMKWFLNKVLAPNNSNEKPYKISLQIINNLNFITVFFRNSDKPQIFDIDDVLNELNSIDSNKTISYELYTKRI